MCNKYLSYLVGLSVLLSFVFFQSYGVYRLILLAFAVSMIAIGLIVGKIRIYSYSPLWFLLLMSIVAMVWGLAGIMQGNPVEAAFDYIRLYVVYIFVYMLLVTYLANVDYYRSILWLLIISGLLISLTMFIPFLQVIFGINFLPEPVVKEMFLQVGVHSGYVQTNNVNTASLIFIIPFIISYLIVNHESKKNIWVIISLLIFLVASFISGRRVLWFVTIVSPVMILMLFIGIKCAINIALAKKMIVLAVGGILLLSFVTYTIVHIELIEFSGLSERVADFFTSDETGPRSVQAKFLLDLFYENIVFGTGFGGAADFSKNNPWTYELTYVQLLANVGILGVTAISSIMLYFFVWTIKALRMSNMSKMEFGINLSILNGMLCYLIAAATNPYLGSFDGLFPFAIMPLIISSKKKIDCNDKTNKFLSTV